MKNPAATGHDGIVSGEAPIPRDESPVHEWRARQLSRLGVPTPLAEIYADHVDWHQVARLTEAGCPPLLALCIVWLRSRARREKTDDRDYQLA